jgi:hypothetical protein
METKPISPLQSKVMQYLIEIKEPILAQLVAKRGFGVAVARMRRQVASLRFELSRAEVILEIVEKAATE